MPGVSIFLKSLKYLQQTPQQQPEGNNNNNPQSSSSSFLSSAKSSRDLFARRVLLTSSVSFLYGLTPYVVEEYAHSHNQYERFLNGMIFTREENTMLLRRAEWQSKMKNVILMEDDPSLEYILYVMNVPTLKFLKNLHVPSGIKNYLTVFARIFGIVAVSSASTNSVEPPRLESLSLSFFQLFLEPRSDKAPSSSSSSTATAITNPLSTPENFMKVLIKFSSTPVSSPTFCYGHYLRAIDFTACCLIPDALFVKFIENTPNLEYVELKNALVKASSIPGSGRLTQAGCCGMLSLVGKSLKYLGLEHSIASPEILEHIATYCAPYNRLQVLKLENMIPHYVVGGSQDAIHTFTNAAVKMFEEFNKALTVVTVNDEKTMRRSSLRVLTMSRSSFVSNRVMEVIGQGTIGPGLFRFEIANPGSEVDPNSLIKLFFGHHSTSPLSSSSSLSSSLLELRWLNLGNFEYRTNRTPGPFNVMFRKICASAPYIRKLDLFFNTVIVTDETLQIIGEELHESLEELDLDGCRSLTTSGVLFLAQSCKKLKILTCIGHDELFCDEFLSILGEKEDDRSKFEKLILGKQHQITRKGILDFAKNVGESLKSLLIKLPGETRESAMMLDAAIREYCPYVDVLVDFMS